MGAAGLAALGLSPVSALDIKDDNFEVYTGTSKSDLSKYLSLGQGNITLFYNDSSGEGIKFYNYNTNNTILETSGDNINMPSGNLNISGELTEGSAL